MRLAFIMAHLIADVNHFSQPKVFKKLTEKDKETCLIQPLNRFSDCRAWTLTIPGYK